MVRDKNAGVNTDLSVNMCVCVHTCTCTYDMCIYKMTSWDNVKFYYELWFLGLIVYFEESESNQSLQPLSWPI